jgi:hypothetical protein
MSTIFGNVAPASLAFSSIELAMLRAMGPVPERIVKQKYVRKNVGDGTIPQTQQQRGEDT